MFWPAVAFVFFCLGPKPTLAKKSCGQAEKCADAFKDLRDLFICRVSNAMGPRPMERVFKSIVKQYCKGKSLDEIGASLENIVMASGDLTFFARSVAYLEPLETCLKEHDTSPKTVLEQAGRAVKTTFREMFQEAINVVAPFKNKCNDPELFKTIGRFGCPYMTHEMVQKLFTTIKQEVGRPFECLRSMDRKLLFLGEYDL